MSNLWTLTGPDAVRSNTQKQKDLPGETMHGLFWAGVNERKTLTMMREKKFGIWKAWNWQEAGTAVREITMGLASLGLQPSQTCSVLANTVVEWLLADMAILSAGGVSNGIYPTDSAVQVQYLCEDSGTQIIFVEDDEQLDKVLEVWDQLPKLTHVVVFDFDGLENLQNPRVLLWRSYGPKAKHLTKPIQDCLSSVLFLENQMIWQFWSTHQERQANPKVLCIRIEAFVMRFEVTRRYLDRTKPMRGCVSSPFATSQSASEDRLVRYTPAR